MEIMQNKLFHLSYIINMNMCTHFLNQKKYINWFKFKHFRNFIKYSMYKNSKFEM